MTGLSISILRLFTDLDPLRATGQLSKDQVVLSEWSQRLFLPPSQASYGVVIAWLELLANIGQVLTGAGILYKARSVCSLH